MVCAPGGSKHPVLSFESCELCRIHTQWLSHIRGGRSNALLAVLVLFSAGVGALELRRAKRSTGKGLARVPLGGQPQSPLTDVRQLILAARQTVARGVNAAVVLLDCQIGQRIRKDILGERRAEYGEEIVATLSRHCRDNWDGAISLTPFRQLVRPHDNCHKKAPAYLPASGR